MTQNLECFIILNTHLGSTVKIKKEFSYGIIPLKYLDEQWEVFLVQHQAGHWSFPKGHPEPDETPQETAERELKEETGLIVKKYLTPEIYVEDYSFINNGQLIEKRVSYFIASVEGHEKLQLHEIQAGRWVKLENADKLITFKEGQRVCRRVIGFLIK